MVRNRASAKKAGADLEIGQETYWRQALRQPQIHRGRNQGTTDKGDLLGVHLTIRDDIGQEQQLGALTIECKNEATVKLGPWWKEAETERRNNRSVIYSSDIPISYPSPAAVVIHKRHGYDVRKQPGQQWVTMTVETLITILNGNTNHIEKDPA